MQAGIRIGGRNINNLRYVDDTTLVAEREDELKSLLMKVKEESERAGLRLNIKKLRSWHLAPLVVTDFLFLGSRVTVDGDCSHEIRRWLLLGRRTVTNLDSVLKSRDISLLTKVRIVKAVVFPVVYSCERWTIKKAEHQRIDACELWCWRRLLRVPWTTRRSNQSILRKSILNINWKDWCWSSNPFATWWEEPTHWKRPWCWERFREGGEEGNRESKASPIQWTGVWANSGK